MVGPISKMRKKVSVWLKSNGPGTVQILRLTFHSFRELSFSSVFVTACQNLATLGLTTDLHYELGKWKFFSRNVKFAFEFFYSWTITFQPYRTIILTSSFIIQVGPSISALFDWLIALQIGLKIVSLKNTSYWSLNIPPNLTHASANCNGIQCLGTFSFQWHRLEGFDVFKISSKRNKLGLLLRCVFIRGMLNYISSIQKHDIVSLDRRNVDTWNFDIPYSSFNKKYTMSQTSFWSTLESYPLRG